MEKIINAAIKFTTDGNSFTIVDKRHYLIFKAMYDNHIEYDKTTAIQGFTTDLGRFLDRTAAYKLALQNGQLSQPKTNQLLLSEDLW